MESPRSSSCTAVQPSVTVPEPSKVPFLGKTESAVSAVFENQKPNLTHDPLPYMNFNTAMVSLERWILSDNCCMVKKLFEQLSPQQKLAALLTPTPDHKVTVLFLAAYMGDESLIDLFIDSYHDEDILLEELRKKQKQGATPLYIAAQRGHETIVEKLLACFKNQEERLRWYFCCRGNFI